MAIHRVGRTSKQPEAVKTPLGCVLVTIDDLDALLSLLANHSDEAVKVEYDGGYFTEAKDLEHLSDEEARSLRLLSEDFQIILTTAEANVVGDKDVGDKVYRMWARTRQTNCAPRVRLSPGYRKLAVWLSLIASFGVGSSRFIIPLVLPQVEPFQMSPHNIAWVIGGMVVAGFLVGALLSITLPLINRPLTFANIVPISLADYRQSRSSQVIPRWSLVVTIVSVVVAIAAIIVSVIAK